MRLPHVVPPIKNSLGHFDETLLSHIQNQHNDEAISIINNSNFRSLADNSKKTLLHYAAKYNNSTFAQYLIHSGCNIDALDAHQNTVLMTAVCAHNEQVVKTLLDANAKIGSYHTKDKHIMATPLVLKLPQDLKILKMLFDKVTDECSDNNDVARKLLEINCPFPAVVFLKNAELTGLMLDLGCSIDDRLPGTNETALHLAVHFRDIHNVKVLVDRGVDINAKDYQNYPSLLRLKMFPEDDDKLEILTFLLDRGSCLTDETQWGETVMGKLLSKEGSRTLRVLMPYIDMFHRDRYGRTPLHHLATNENAVSMIEFLKDQRYDMDALDMDNLTPVDTAVILHNVCMVQFLLENGANANNVDADGRTSLGFVMNEKMSDKTGRIIELLLQYGADAQFLNDNEFPIIKSTTKYDYAKPLLAHIAMLESVGEPLNKLVLDTIKSTEKFNSYFELCKEQNERMKKIIMYESVTLHELLFERDQKIVKMYALNDEFVSNYELFVKNNKYDLDLYYISTLELRVGKTVNLVQTQEKAAGIICEIIGLPSSMVNTIGANVVKYIQQKDLGNILKM